MIKDNHETEITETNETAQPAPVDIPRQKRGVMPSADIVEIARSQGRTQGRAGCKAHRFNMAFSPEVYNFITTMAKVRGESVTAFVNGILEKAMKDNAEVYQQAIKFKENL